jgi:hypothetical protein
MSEGSNSVPSLVASLFSLTAFVKYGASFASDFNLPDSMFWGKEAYIAPSGHTCSTSLKTSHPHMLLL